MSRETEDINADPFEAPKVPSDITGRSLAMPLFGCLLVGLAIIVIAIAFVLPMVGGLFRRGSPL